MSKATRALERAKARRGEPFPATNVIGPHGRKVRCDCGSLEWQRAPLEDVGERRAFVCAKACGMVLLEVEGPR